MFNALEYALGIYGVSFAVTMVVWLLIVAIRWISSERAQPKAGGAKL